MSATPNHAIAHILQSQAQKEVTANAAFDALDRVIAGLLEVDVSAGSTVAVDPAAALTCKMLRLTGTLAAEAEVVVPDNRKPYFVHNATAGGFAVTVKTAAWLGVAVGSTPDNTAVVYCDGTDVLAIGPAGGGAAAIDDLADVDTATAPPAAGQALVWDATASLWKPGTVGASGGGGGETELVHEPVPLANPGAETGTLSGWTAEAGAWSARTAAGSMAAAHGGTWFFYNESSANGVLTQTVDLLAAGFLAAELDGGATFTLSAWAGSAHQSDTGVVEADWLNAADVVLTTHGSDERGPTNPLGTWEEVTLAGSLPVGARKVRLRLKTVNHFGSNSTYCFDDLALQLGVWREVPPALDDLSDVDTSNVPPQDRDLLRFDAPSGLWRPEALTVTFADLPEVELAAPAAGHLMAYDGAAWTNRHLLGTEPGEVRSNWATLRS